MAAPLTAGELRDQVRIERLTSATTDSGGQGEPVITVLATEWAAIEPVGSRPESLAVGGLQATLTHRIRLWYRTDVRPADRVVEVEPPHRHFEIVVPPQPDAGKREIALLCLEKVD